MGRCPICDGTGRSTFMGEETCGKCAGSGRDVKSNLWNQPCRKCNGRGRVPTGGYQKCRHCGGTGKT